MNKKGGITNLKKVIMMQYITLILPAIVLIVTPLCIELLFTPILGNSAIIIFIFVLMIETWLLPVVGGIVSILSTIALFFYIKNKRKAAHILNFICTVIFVIIAYINSAIAILNPMAIILWFFIAVNLYFDNKAKNLQKIQEEQELFEQNNDED